MQKKSLLQWTVAQRIDVLADNISVILEDKVKTLFHGALQWMKVVQWMKEEYGIIGYTCERCGQGVK